MKLLSIAVIAVFMASCTDGTGHDDSTAADTAAKSVEAAPVPHADTATAASAVIKDDLMAMKDGKMVIMKGGKWEPLTQAVTCTNGRKVAPNGEVSKGDLKRKLTEGMMIDKDGQMIDKDGKLMDNSGWE